jgi:hypothetical protein
MGLVEEMTRVRSVLPPWWIEDCAACGLLQEDGSGGVFAPVMLTPFDDLLIANDHAKVLEDANQPDAVLLVNPTTWLLHRFAVRGQPRNTLELCAGNGAIGLAAGAWSGRVVLSDLSARAVEFATFSASLNGVHNAEFVVGDGFKPVTGTFDRILANPPFYVTPNMQFLYVNNDLGLDQFCRRLVDQVPAYLNEGGYYQMLFEWVELEGQNWEDRLRQWFEGTGCDAWVIEGRTTPTLKYAQERIREAYPFDRENDPSRFAEWMDYYRRHQVVAIRRGLVTMRKRSGANWVRMESCPTTPSVPFGDAIAQRFEAFDFLAGNPTDENILDGRFRVLDGVKINQRLSFENGKFQPEALELTANISLPAVQKIEPLVAGFLDRLDGTRPVREMTRQMAERAGAPVEKVSAECAGVIRRLLERGFVQRETATGTASAS